MNILVIGGTYFAGRVFTMTAARDRGHTLTLVNRGKYSMTHIPGVKEYACDRHDALGLEQIPADDYDAVVDFCAYQSGEIRTLFQHLRGRFGRYILISTADVYERRDAAPRREGDPLLTEHTPGPVGDYLYSKMLLEGEARSICAQREIPLTILRPAFLYGPFNYAPREAYYIREIVAGRSIPVPTDSDSRFQFAYIFDLARAILLCMEKAPSSTAYNISAPEEITYRRYMEVLREVSDLPVNTVPVTVDQVLREGIPLPFPLEAAENELFDGSRITRELGLEYTPFTEGMKAAYQAFKRVFQ